MAKINVRKYYKENARLYRNLSIDMRIILTKFFDKYSDRASREYLKNLRISSGFYQDFWSELYKKLFNNTTKIEVSVNDMIKRIREEQKQDIIDDAYREGILAQNVTQITETTRKEVQKAIELGISEGIAIGEIATEIQKNKAFSRARAKTIARTETHTAMNSYLIRNAKVSTLKNPKKQWLSAMDERARDWHKAMNNRQVDINEDYVVNTPIAGGQVVPKYMNFVGDPKGGASNVINCRCFQLIVDERDELLGDFEND